MTEPGSDELLTAIADTTTITDDLAADNARRAAEEALVSEQPEASDEPGEAYPDPDEAPPSDQPHDEYDPTPPEAS